MYEVELKVPAELEPVRERLEVIGAKRLGAARQADAYHDHPARSFAETDEALRIRREADRAVLTYKGPKVDATSKTRREVETAVEDPEAAESLLGALGFEPVATVEKARERYAVDGYLVTLDDVVGVGTFVEVEAEGPEEAIDELRSGALEVLEWLGLDGTDAIRTSYLELVLDASE